MVRVVTLRFVDGPDIEPVPPGGGDGCALINPNCLIDTAVGNAGEKFVGYVVETAVDGVTGLLDVLGTAWFSWPSPNIFDEQSGLSPAVSLISQSLAPYVLVIAALSFLFALGKMMWTLRASEAKSILRLLIILAAVTGVSAITVQTLLAAGDAFSPWIISQAAGEPFTATTFQKRLLVQTIATGNLSAFLIVVLLLSVLMMLGTLAQVAFMIVRAPLIITMLIFLPVAAASTATDEGMARFRKMIAYLLAAVLYKPVAAIIYATGIALVRTSDEGSAQDQLLSMIYAFIIIVFAAVALPALIKFFMPIAAIGSSSAFSGGAAAAATGAVVMGGAMLASGAAGGAAGAAGGKASGAAMPPPTGAPMGALGSGSGSPGGALPPGPSSNGGGSGGGSSSSGGGSSSSGGGAGQLVPSSGSGSRSGTGSSGGSSNGSSGSSSGGSRGSSTGGGASTDPGSGGSDSGSAGAAGGGASVEADGSSGSSGLSGSMGSGATPPGGGGQSSTAGVSSGGGFGSSGRSSSGVQGHAVGSAGGGGGAGGGSSSASSGGSSPGGAGGAGSGGGQSPFPVAGVRARASAARAADGGTSPVPSGVRRSAPRGARQVSEGLVRAGAMAGAGAGINDEAPDGAAHVGERN